MRTALCFLVCLLIAPLGRAASSPGFGISVYIQVRDVLKFQDPAVLQAQWDQISSQVKVDKVYIEVHRDRILAPDALLEAVKAFFVQHGVQVAAGSAFSDSEADLFKSFCYTNAADRAYVKGVAELAARHFDEFILDDFFFVNTKFDSDIAAKGERSWSQFRLDLMDQAGQELIVNAAKAVNPKIKVVIKFPNWYEHFQGLGFDLDKEPKIFDGIYTGTETRDPTVTDQFLQQYESYEIIRYYENIKPGGNGGGWVDPYSTLFIDRYAEQLWDTLLAKARELTLFSWSNLLLPAQAGDRAAWENLPTSLNYREVVASYKPGAGMPATPVVATVAGAAIRSVEPLIGQLGNPIGIDSYKPYQSLGEDFLHNYIGMLGIPVNLHPEFPTGARVVLLTEAAQADPQIVEKIKTQLQHGGNVVITSGLLRALQDRGIKDICETYVSDSKVLAKDYKGFFGPVDLAGDRRAPILFAEVRFMTNDAWSLVNAVENGQGYPLLLMDKYSHGYLYVWTIPDDFRNLYALPPLVINTVKNVVMRGFPVRMDGPTQVALFAYDNHTFVVESFLPDQATVKVTVQGTFTRLRNLATGQDIAALPADQPKGPGARRRNLFADDTPHSSFTLSVLPHSFAGYAPEP